ncbi:MAG TPA: hypothetical protein VFP54_00170 [Acidimicrobiales bacterium]|nr:hypothetical protein [Acidimicrobiales bacterium]
MAALEARLAALSRQVQTAELRARRLTLVDEAGRERLVAEMVGTVAELRFDLPGLPPGRRTSLLLFAVPDQPDWCAGLGVQLWVDGNLVDELTWWQDQHHRPSP